MHRATLLVLLVLTGCNRDRGALQAVIQYDTAVRASCVALDVLDSGGGVLQTLNLDRPEDPERNTLTVAVFRGELPDTVQLQARALWGNGCAGALAGNGKSTPVEGQFKPGESTRVELTLQRPARELDADGDGFIDAARGGPDCDDARDDRKPGVQELCDGTQDLNCDDKRGCDDNTCQSQACARAPTSLVFTTSAQTKPAGGCSQAIVVERRDSLGNPSTFGLPTPLTLGTTLPGGVAFFADAACSSSLAPAIAANGSTLTFYVKGTKAGQGELSASADSLSSSVLTHAIVAGPGTKPRITSSANTLRAGECVPFTFDWLDAYDNVAVGKAKSVTVTAAMDARLYQDSACQQEATTTDLTQEGTSLTLYFSGTRTGTVNLVVEGTMSVKAQQEQTVRPNLPRMFTLEGTAAQTIFAGECSSAMTVRMFDRFNNPTSFDTATTLNLSSNSPGDFGFYADAGCTGTVLTALPLAAGATSPRFSFKGKTGGSVTITARQPDLEPANQSVNQTHVLIPVVRRGKCGIADGQTASSGCTIDPPVRDLNKSFLVFQATNNTSTTRDAFVRCELRQNQVACSRVGSSGDTTLQWQVVERPTGLRVQHLPVGCSANRTTKSFTSVSRDKSFLLFSSSADGGTVGYNEFAGVQFTSPTQAEIVLNTGDCYSTSYALQVVEWEGLTVSQGSTGAMSGTSLSAAGTPGVPDLSRTVLLTTHQASEETNADICNRLVRGELTSDTEMNFTIAAGQTCSGAKVPTIVWQRITFPTSTLVHTARLATSASGASSADFPMAVDPTRTLLMSSSQAHGGQGSGESGFRASDTPGEASGRLTLSADNKRIELERDSTSAPARWTAYAIQFEP